MDHVALSLILLGAAYSAKAESAPGDGGSSIEFFEKKVRPLLVDNCYTCHSANTNSKGGLRVDDRNGLLVGGNGSPAVVPGDSEESLLLKAVRYHDEDDLKMPPKTSPPARPHPNSLTV